MGDGNPPKLGDVKRGRIVRVLCNERTLHAVAAVVTTLASMPIRRSTFPVGLALGGDPTAAGWVITGLYGLTGVACFRAWRRSKRAAATAPVASLALKRESQGWFLILAATVLFGLNKQLDLQTTLTAFGRELARSEGWYAWRREVQLAFMILVTTGTAGVLAAGWRVGRRWRLSGALWLAFIGQAWLAVFYLMRGISHHHVDALLRVGLPAARTRDVVEAAGLVVTSVAAIGRGRRRPPEA